MKKNLLNLYHVVPIYVLAFRVVLKNLIVLDAPVDMKFALSVEKTW